MTAAWLSPPLPESHSPSSPEARTLCRKGARQGQGCFLHETKTGMSVRANACPATSVYPNEYPPGYNRQQWSRRGSGRPGRPANADANNGCAEGVPHTASLASLLPGPNRPQLPSYEGGLLEIGHMATAHILPTDRGNRMAMSCVTLDTKIKGF